jgi:GT2 family glycosyltransferase
MRLLVRAARAPLASIRITLAIARKARTLIARDGLAFTVRRSIRFVAHYGLVGTAALLRTSSASSASRAPDRNSMDGTMGAVLHKVGTPENARAIELDHSLSLPLPYAASEPRAPGGAVGVILHLDHPELAVEFRSYLRNITAPADLYISVLDEAARAQVLNAFDGWEWGKLEVRVVPNRGRDIAPKLIGLCDAYDRHELVLHLHSKQHDHASVLSRWRHHLLENLVGTPDTVSSVFDLFARLPELGMVAAQHFEPMRHCVDWGHNLKCAIALGQRMGIEIESGGVLDFPSGSMFWARSAALRPLLDLGLAFEDFPAEQGQRDGTPADAIERLYFMVCEKAGFDWIKVARPNLFSVTPAIITTQDERDLEQYLSQYLFRLLAPGAQRARSLPPAPVAAPSPGLLDQLRNHTLGAAERLHPGSRVALGIVAYNNEASGLRLAVGAAMQSLRAAGLPEEGAVLLLDNGADSATAVPDGGAVRRLPSVGNVGFGAGHNRLMKEAFARGTDLYVAVNPDGVLHPEAVGALLRMVQAHDGRALVEALQFPMEHPKPYDPATLDTPWLSGACLAIPRAAHEVLGGFDEDFFMYCEDVDLSWRARAQGFALKTCPTALFLHAVTNRPSSELTRRMMFQSGVILARKWGSPAFEAWLRPELEALGASLPEAAPVGVPTEWRRYADFSHRFSFAKPRW